MSQLPFQLEQCIATAMVITCLLVQMCGTESVLQSPTGHTQELGFSDQTDADTDLFELKDDILEWCREGKRELNQDEVFHYLVNKDDLNDNEINMVLEDNTAWHETHAMVQRMFTILDTNADGILECEEEIKYKLSLETLQKLANVDSSSNPTDVDAEQYKHAELSSIEIRMFLEDMISRLDEIQTMNQKEFFYRYKLIGGSIKKGSEIFDLMDQSLQGFVTRHDVLSKMEDILQLFERVASHKQGLNGRLVDDDMDNEVGPDRKWDASRTHEEL